MNVVALLLKEMDAITLRTYGLDFAPEIELTTAQQLSVVGFPSGRTGGGFFAIWIQGTVVTEPTVDYEDLPCFLIDARTRGGQSGSPVILRSPSGEIILANESLATYSHSVTKIFGVFALAP